MSKIILVAGSLNHKKLIEKNSGKDENVIFLSEKSEAGSLTPKSISGAEKTEPEKLNIIWNKRSPLSARNSILTIINRHKRIDEAIISYQPGEFNKTFHEISTPVYDLMIDRWIKGYGYLLKELIQLFIKQKSGRISLILDSNGLKVMTPVESAVFSYLKTFVQNLSILYQNEAFRIYCFESDSNRAEDFINFYFKTISEGRYVPGKLYKFTDRKSLFDFGRT
ncbi:MAG: hypothetical protein JEZ04_11110 [Spirochaetales bacterium]|nr:hypothetical protein [Spirochaetales bacterium]